MHASQEIRLRPAEHSDAGAIAGLIRAAFAGPAEITDPKPSALRENADSVLATLVAGGGAVAVVDDSMVGRIVGRMVGAVLWQPRDGGLYFGRLAVAPDCQGRGIARRLLELVEAEARARNLPCLKLSTRLVWTGNRRLFASLGFVETAQHAHPGYAAPTFVDMEKQLA